MSWGKGRGRERGEKSKIMEGREMGMHEKIASKCSIFGIMGTPLV